jgi:hypothetical protein
LERGLNARIPGGLVAVHESGPVANDPYATLAPSRLMPHSMAVSLYRVLFFWPRGHPNHALIQSFKISSPRAGVKAGQFCEDTGEMALVGEAAGRATSESDSLPSRNRTLSCSTLMGRGPTWCRRAYYRTCICSSVGGRSTSALSTECPPAGRMRIRQPATYGLVIFFGSTIRSKSSAET